MNWKRSLRKLLSDKERSTLNASQVKWSMEQFDQLLSQGHDEQSAFEAIYEKMGAGDTGQAVSKAKAENEALASAIDCNAPNPSVMEALNAANQLKIKTNPEVASN